MIDFVGRKREAIEVLAQNLARQENRADAEASPLNLGRNEVLLSFVLLGLADVAEQLTGAHPRILFVTASAFLRFGPDAYAMRSQSIGGTLEELLVQLASEGRPVRASVTV